MGDEGDFWRDLKPAMQEASKQKRKRNREHAVQILTDVEVPFVSKNNGIHLIVYGRNCIIDFWPGTGKYIIRGGKTGRGVRHVLELC